MAHRFVFLAMDKTITLKLSLSVICDKKKQLFWVVELHYFYVMDVF